jgi:hypothetical protein
MHTRLQEAKDGTVEVIGSIPVAPIFLTKSQKVTFSVKFFLPERRQHPILEPIVEFPVSTLKESTTKPKVRRPCYGDSGKSVF